MGWHSPSWHLNNQWGPGIQGMWKRVPQLKAVASVLFDFFTHLQGGRKTSRHRDNQSGRARREAGGLCAQEQGGSRNQNGPLHGGPWERTEEQTPGAECYGFSLGLSGGGRRGFGRKGSQRPKGELEDRSTWLSFWGPHTVWRPQCPHVLAAEVLPSGAGWGRGEA